MPSQWVFHTRAVFTHSTETKCLLTIAAPSASNLIIPRYSIAHACTTSVYAYTRWLKVTAGTTTGSTTILATEDGGTSGESQRFTVASGPVGSAGVDAQWTTTAPPIVQSGGVDILYEHDLLAANGGSRDWTGVARARGGIVVPANTLIGLYVTCTGAAYAPAITVYVNQ